MSYTAAVLSDISQSILRVLLKELVPDSFEFLGHHMTLHMGDPLPEDQIGKNVFLVASQIARDEKVIAIKIIKGGEISSNKTPHITIAVNRENGGKPYMSNNLSDWKNLDTVIDVPFITLIATIQKCD